MGLWRGVGYALPYTVSCMMLAFGTTLGLRFVRALREAHALNQTLEERVRERQRLMREMHDGLGGQLVSSLALVEASPGVDPELLAALRGRLEPTLERCGIRFRWRVLDAPTPHAFGPEQRCSTSCASCRRRSPNAVRHASPSIIEVATSVDDGHLVIAIRDDGRGFPPRLQRGRGLSNIERRAPELGGALRIDSGEGGTRVELRLSLS